MKNFAWILLLLCSSYGFLSARNHQRESSHRSPSNFLLSKGPSQAINGFESQPQEFYYWSINSFFDGKFAVAWPDNRKVPFDQDPSELNLVVRTGTVEDQSRHRHCRQLKPNLGKLTTLIQAEPNQFAGNVQTLINPAIPGNLFVFSTFRDRNLPFGGPEQRQLWRAVSFDGGKTFPVVSRIFGLPDLIVDTLAGVDKFGNIWLSYLTGPLDDPNNFRTVVLAVSTDGGVSFTQVTQLNPPSPYTVGYDLPYITFGGDGKGGYGLWFAPTIIDANFNVAPTLGFIPVSGLGEYDVGHMQTVIYASLASFDWEPSLSVTKDGRVFLVSVQSDESTQSSNDGVKFLAKLDGTKNLVDGNYVGPTIIQQRTIGAYVNPPFLPTGTFLTVAPQAIGFDEKHQLLHVLFVDNLGVNSPDYGVYLISSKNNGVNWTPRRLISDTTQGPRGFQASLAVDRKNGNLFMSWWDARNDPTAQTVEMFGALLPFCQFRGK
jgi:hypothetical protein